MLLRQPGLLLLALLLLVVATPTATEAVVSFLPPVSYPKVGAADLTAVDFDGDGRLDLAVT
jgi:hypothetical protein